MGTVVEEKRRRTQRKEVRGPFVKTGGPFEAFLTMNAKPLREGRYRIAWYVECKFATVTGGKIKARVRINNTNTIGVHTWWPDDDWDGKSGFDLKKFSDGDTPTFTIEVRREGAGGDMDIQSLKLTLERLLRDE